MIEYDGQYKVSACPVVLKATYDTGDLVDVMVDDQGREGVLAVGVRCSIESCAVRALMQRFEAPGAVVKTVSLYHAETCKNPQ